MGGRHRSRFRPQGDVIESAPDTQLVILDLGLPDSDGLALLKTIREQRPATAVVVLSSSTAPDVMAEALDVGAVGFIPKSAPRAVMVSALGLILAGGIYIPPEAWPARRTEVAPASDERAPTPAELGLTERQLHVLALLVQGRSNKAIARSLSIAEVTVKHHVTTLMRALKVQNRRGGAGDFPFWLAPAQHNLERFMETMKRSRLLSYRIFLTRTGTHFARKCSK